MKVRDPLPVPAQYTKASHWADVVESPMIPPRPTLLRSHLDTLYHRYNHRRFVEPDPLAAVYPFENTADQEIAALIASALAFGTVKQILGSIRSVLDTLGPPEKALREADAGQLRETFAAFRHRYVTGREVVALLLGMRRVRAAYGSLGAAFAAQLRPDETNVFPALTRFAALLHGGEKNYLLPDPARGSACKRWMLYLRWMVRKDTVDLGCWRGVSPSQLIVPMDTHMHRIALRLGFTSRKTADAKAALETTAAFRVICPEDTVRYDFALTRLGIRKELDGEDFFTRCGCPAPVK